MNFPKEMKKDFIIILVLFMISVLGWPAESLGHIQIKCEPGVQIFLDGNNMGATRSDVGGLILQDVLSGKHKLKAVKEGYQPLEATIELAGNQVLMYEFKSFIPTFETYEEGEESESITALKTGKIIIQTLPMECSISIPALNIESLQKTKDKRIFDKVPVGIYEIDLVGLGKKVKHNVQVKEDETVRLMVNFLKEEIKEEGLKASETLQDSSPSSTPVTQTPSPSETRRAANEQGTPPSQTPAPDASIMPPTREGVAGDILFSDIFTGEDKTRPGRWTFVNADTMDFWYLLNGELVTGNGDDLQKYNGYSYALINAPGAESWKDYTVQCSFWMTQSNGRVLLLARWRDKDNHYEGVYETFDRNRYLKIQKVQAGTIKTLKILRSVEGGIVLPLLEKGSSAANGAEMRFTVLGRKLILALGDKATLEAEDSSFTEGSAGVGQWCNFVYFDNIEVKKVLP